MRRLANLSRFIFGIDGKITVYDGDRLLISLQYRKDVKCEMIKELRIGGWGIFYCIDTLLNYF